MSAHYRKQLNFTLDGIRQADQALERIDNLIVRLKDIKKAGDAGPETGRLIKSLFTDFTGAMDNDLNISGGLGIFFDFVSKVNTMISEEKLSEKDASAILEAIARLDTVFGFISFGEEDDVDAERINALVEERIQAKKNKDFKRSDEIRDMLKNEGIILEDTKDGTRWKRKK